MKSTVYIATSLDGFIARENGDLDWLSSGGGADNGGEDYGYHAFMDTVDVLVMGRHSYEKVLSFGGDWPYGVKPVVVLSSRALEIPPRLGGCVESMSCSPTELVTRLADRGASHLYIDGGQTVQRFLAAGLIERFIITRIPVLLGRGLPLFGPLDADIRLQHVETRSYPNGLVQSEYTVVR
jgi:dihydrofolate reductase